MNSRTDDHDKEAAYTYMNSRTDDESEDDHNQPAAGGAAANEYMNSRTDGESEDDHDQAAAGAAAANYTNLNTFNGNLRKSNPDIPETIAEDE